MNNHILDKKIYITYKINLSINKYKSIRWSSSKSSEKRKSSPVGKVWVEVSCGKEALLVKVWR